MADRVLSRSEAATILFRLGWRINTTWRLTLAIKNFQRGWNLGPALTVDGKVGPLTSHALLLSEARRVAKLGTASANFSFSEFQCKCEGRYGDCPRIWAPRALFAEMEYSRKQVGHPIHIVSGGRCRRYNAKIGGAKQSRHMVGDAADWKGPNYQVVKSWKRWHGIGFGAHSQDSLHTDLRPTANVNTPMTWIYPGW